MGEVVRAEQAVATDLAGAPSNELPSPSIQRTPPAAATDKLLGAGCHSGDPFSGTTARLHFHPQAIQERSDDLITRDPGTRRGSSALPEPDTDKHLRAPVVTVSAIKHPGAAVAPRAGEAKRSAVTRLGRHEARLRRSRAADAQLHDTSLGLLSEKLFAACTKAESLHHRFLPDSELLRLVNPTTVVRELNRCRSRGRAWGLRRGPGRTDKSLNEFAAVICGADSQLSKSYRRIFAILVMMDRPWSIYKFVRHTNDDSGLPYEGREGGIGVKKVRYYHLAASGYPSISEPQTKATGREGETEKHGKSGKPKRPTPKPKPKPLKCFRCWMPSKKRLFEDRQWTVQAPFFSRRSDPDNPIHRYDFPDKAILPFTLWEPVGAGGAGEVFKVRIHPAHHGFERTGSKTDDLFAVKRLFCSDLDAIRAETRMLKLLSRKCHPHLNPLLTTYTQNHKFYLVFHWAEWDLWEYWKRHGPRSHDDGKAEDSSFSTALWLAQECTGLASSLLRIHGPHDPASFAHQDSFPKDIAEMTSNDTKTVPTTTEASASEQPPPPPPPSSSNLCHHGDIKAINILLFSRPDAPQRVPALAGLPPPAPRHEHWTLKISDFGLAGFHKPGTERTGKTAWTPTYIPPEWEVRPDRVQKPACDIWALGCVFLQFIGWYLGGFEMVEKFEQARVAEDGRTAFYRLPVATEVGEGEAGGTASVFKVKESVTKFIGDCHRNKMGSQYLDDFLDLIQNHMLAEQLEAGCEGTLKPCRLPCATIESRLRDMLEKYF